MRSLLALLLTTAALPAGAETLMATSRITAVTLYPDGAQITRVVDVTLPGPGAHELLVTDLPASTEAGRMRLSTSGGDAALGAFSLRADRLPPRDEGLTSAQEAAKAALEAAEDHERAALAVVEAIEARIRAAEARAAFLTSFSGGLPENASADSLRAMAAMVGEETLAAAEAVAAAKLEFWPSRRDLEAAQKARAQAQAAYDALPARDADYTALSVALEAEGAGPAQVTVSHFVYGAGWRPFYDLHLTRQGGAKVGVERSILVTQTTGEDWSGVDLTLSSSRPSEQAAPSTLWPELRRIEKEAPPMPDMAARKSVSAAAGADMVVAEAAPAPVTALAGMEGDTVIWAWPRAVDIASGVEDLRLSLDRLEMPAEVLAIAVPRMDRTAFLQAEFTNDSNQPLLPGEALLYREGVLVGGAFLEMTAPGVETKLAFGPIETLRLKRDMPLRDQGQRGVFSTSNELTETATLKIENTGTESWPVRLLDQVPYSEQQELKITTTANPAPNVTDLDGQRGILAWEFEIAPGEKREIGLTHALSWPEGMVLR